MKKILFVINTLGHAGAETAFLELVRNMDPGQYELHLFVLLGQGELVKRLPGDPDLVHLAHRSVPPLKHVERLLQ